ncbi:hypothetical protein J5N97_008203 [Dioscorea zingiberensis]|uniref:Uncharacterized protein n=1 Tax=Dioscorea zingiberensis TaxID=325984 RepID=A0A9D5DHK4_9LILI|nr:hypothetical protein J5N97_008203 [Dioscorea zingiberensis]
MIRCLFSFPCQTEVEAPPAPPLQPTTSSSSPRPPWSSTPTPSPPSSPLRPHARATAAATWPGLNRANRSSRFPVNSSAVHFITIRNHSCLYEAEELSIRLERWSSPVLLLTASTRLKRIF